LLKNSGFDFVLKGRGFNRLRKNSGQRPNREGHDVQSCHKSRNISVGFSRWGSLSTQQPLFPQTVLAAP
jgi:hypothetical protein